jgi:hypothetical protein
LWRGLRGEFLGEVKGNISAKSIVLNKLFIQKMRVKRFFSGRENEKARPIPSF